MVIFSECPQCKGQQTVKLNKDISLVERKTKFKREVECSACGTAYLIAVRIKARLMVKDEDLNRDPEWNGLD
jgi:transcriptional regulator NrdR family protein